MLIAGPGGTRPILLALFVNGDSNALEAVLPCKVSYLQVAMCH
jgi:hypothetical protein